jgi:hypothetical protein
MTRRVRCSLFLSSSFVLVPLALGGPALRDALCARWYARGLRSSDLSSRKDAQTRLRALGRPRIDCVWTELIASELSDVVSGRACLIAIATCVRSREYYLPADTYTVSEVLRNDLGVPLPTDREVKLLRASTYSSERPVAARSLIVARRVAHRGGDQCQEPHVIFQLELATEADDAAIAALRQELGK